MSTDFVKDFNIILSEYEKTNGITLDELNSDLKVKTAIERMKELSKVYDEVITDEEHLILSKENFISSLKDRNYTYDQLLELIASMAIIEELNKQKTDLLEAEIKVITLANSAITDLMQDKDKATNYLLELNEVQSQFNSTGAKLEGYKKGRDFQKIYQARNAVKAKLAKDPKQLAKIEITQCYDAVKEKVSEKYDSVKEKVTGAINDGRDMLNQGQGKQGSTSNKSDVRNSMS